MAKTIKSSTKSSDGKRMLGARIDESLARLLKSNAAKHGLTTQELVIQLVRDYLKKEGDLR